MADRGEAGCVHPRRLSRQKMPRTEPDRPIVIALPVAICAALLGRCGRREPKAMGASGLSLEDFVGDEILRPTRIGELAACAPGWPLRLRSPVEKDSTSGPEPWLVRALCSMRRSDDESVQNRP